MMPCGDEEEPTPSVRGVVNYHLTSEDEDDQSCTTYKDGNEEGNAEEESIAAARRSVPAVEQEEYVAFVLAGELVDIEAPPILENRRSETNSKCVSFSKDTSSFGPPVVENVLFFTPNVYTLYVALDGQTCAVLERGNVRLTPHHDHRALALSSSE
jgi:hypothetical protein